jgi:hypothetical protein
MSQQELPLFPLNTVMFPGMPLTLHIFEERYREMIGHCLEANNPFGVVLIRDGSEVGGPAMHHDVGTFAQINASVRLEDGRILIATTGQQRFRVTHSLQLTPYKVATVIALPEEEGEGLSQTVQELRAMYDHYWRAVKAATGVEPDVESLPDDVVAMSYQLAHRLQVTNERKQRWLEVDVQTRVRDMIAMLRAEIELLPRLGGESSPSSSNVPWSWN